MHSLPLAPTRSAWIEAYRQHNLERMAAAEADDFLCITNGIATAKQARLHSLKRAWAVCPRPVLDFTEEATLEQHADHCHVRGEALLLRDGQPAGRTLFEEQWQRVEGGWRIQRLECTTRYHR